MRISQGKHGSKLCVEALVYIVCFGFFFVDSAFLNVYVFFILVPIQDPEVMAAFQDVAQNPANISKYQNNPKIMALVTKLSAKFGASPQP